jgi:CPA2 family monovalent cation:H+ antiporter-2
MSDTAFLQDGAIVLGIAVAVAWMFRIVRVPSIIGFLITGMAIGPSGWQLIGPERVSEFSEIGLVLLLFTIGLELSPEPLLRSGRRLIQAALIQIVLTMILVLPVLFLNGGVELAGGMVIALAVALSSTAIVLKQMSDRGETRSTTGLITTGILLLQDVIVIALLLVVSLASSRAEGSWQGAAARSGGGLLGVLILIAFSRRGLPAVLNQISRHGGRELITLFAVVMACGGAWLAHLVGWSPALGACIAGLLLAGADQRHQLVAEVTPFRDVFNAIFFIALGMSVRLENAFAHLILLDGAIIATLLLKPAITALAVRLAGWPVRIGIQVGIGLCTVSEFSYVLVRQACEVNLLPPESLDLMVAYAVGTMMIGALLYPVAAPLSLFLSKYFHAGEHEKDQPEDTAEPQGLENHVIIVGYGLTGVNLAKMLAATHTPYCVVEMNQSLLQDARKTGAPVIMGDATRMTILEHAGIDAARVLVVAINEKQATQRIVAQVSARRPDLYLLARTNFAADIEALYQRGAKLVIPEDFETSIEVAAHVLKRYGIPDNIVEAQVAAVRTGGYGMLRGKSTTRAGHAELIKILERTTTQTYYLAEESPICGQTVAQTNLRARTGCLIIAVVRAGKPITSPQPDFALQANDVLVLVGAHVQIDAARRLLDGTPDPSSA